MGEIRGLHRLAGSSTGCDEFAVEPNLSCGFAPSFCCVPQVSAFLLVVACLFLFLLPAWGQSGNAAHPFSSTPQWTLWMGGGPSVPTGSVSYRTAAFASLGYVTPLHFWHFGQHTGFLDGFWEYQTEFPVYAVFQKHMALAIGYTPIGFRYVMHAHQRIRPFIGGLAGLLYATRNIPDGASRFNFSPQAEIGLSMGNESHRIWNLEVRYIHISDAGLHHPNPGLNTVLVLAGYTF